MNVKNKKIGDTEQECLQCKLQTCKKTSKSVFFNNQIKHNKTQIFFKKVFDEYRQNQHNTPRKADMVRQIKVMATQLSWLEHNTHNVGVASSNLAVATKFAGLAKLVDAPDLGSGAERCVGSSPSSRTIYQLSVKQQLGYRQAVRHRVLISASLGSNPSTPAIFLKFSQLQQKLVFCLI